MTNCSAVCGGGGGEGKPGNVEEQSWGGLLPGEWSAGDRGQAALEVSEIPVLLQLLWLTAAADSGFECTFPETTTVGTMGSQR